MRNSIEYNISFAFGVNRSHIHVLFIEDFCKLLLKQLKYFKLFENNIFCVGGGKANVINLKKLTEMCKTITNNKVKVFQKSKTSIF